MKQTNKQNQTATSKWIVEMSPMFRQIICNGQKRTLHPLTCCCCRCGGRGGHGWAGGGAGRGSRYNHGLAAGSIQGCRSVKSCCPPPPGPRFAASHSLSLTPSVCANSMPDVIKAWATDRLTPVVASLCELASIDSHDNVSILENPVSLVGSALLWIQANLLLSCTSFLTDAANPLLLTHTHTRIHMHVPSS